MSVYRRSLPEKASPIIAVTLYSAGEYEKAYKRYLEVSNDLRIRTFQYKHFKRRTNVS